MEVTKVVLKVGQDVASEFTTTPYEACSIFLGNQGLLRRSVCKKWGKRQQRHRHPRRLRRRRRRRRLCSLFCDIGGHGDGKADAVDDRRGVGRRERERIVLVTKRERERERETDRTNMKSVNINKSHHKETCIRKEAMGSGALETRGGGGEAVWRAIIWISGSSLHRQRTRLDWVLKEGGGRVRGERVQKWGLPRGVQPIPEEAARGEGRKHHHRRLHHMALAIVSPDTKSVQWSAL